MYVHKITSYLTVLLENDITKQQLRCLLATANVRQLNGVCEILYNAYDANSFNLSKNNFKKLEKHSKVLHVLCNTTKYSYIKRLNLLRKHLTIVINILTMLRPSIKKLLDDNLL
jgi:hypothetical protein